MDLAPGPGPDKKMEAEKRAMGMSDYNGDMRKGGRGGPISYRSPGPKDVGPSDPGSYYDKVGRLWESCSMSLSPLLSLLVCSVHLTLVVLYVLSFLISISVPSPSLPLLSLTPPPFPAHSLPSFTQTHAPTHHSNWAAPIGLSLTNQDGYLGDEGHGSLYSPPTVFKSHPLYNHTIPLRQVRSQFVLFCVSGITFVNVAPSPLALAAVTFLSIIM